MSFSPGVMVDSLEIQMQDVAQDNEAQQPGLIAGNGTASVVVDGVHKDTSVVNSLQDPQSPLFVGEETPVPSRPTTPEAIHPEIVSRDGIQVIVHPVQRRWEYLPYDEEPVGFEAAEENDDQGGSRVILMPSSGNGEKVS